MTIMKYRSPAHVTTPVDRLASEIFGPGFARFFGEGPSVPAPRVNIVENDDAFRLDVEVPGFTKDDLTAEVNGDTLTIRGEQATESGSEDTRWTRREFSHSSFERSFVLPKTVQADAIKADHVNGVLQLTIPKSEAAKPKSRTISID